jgi:hypothetical protein
MPSHPTIQNPNIPSHRSLKFVVSAEFNNNHSERNPATSRACTTIEEVRNFPVVDKSAPVVLEFSAKLSAIRSTSIEHGIQKPVVRYMYEYTANVVTFQKLQEDKCVKGFLVTLKTKFWSGCSVLLIVV